MASNDDYRDYAEPSGLDDLGSEHWLPWWADVMGLVLAVIVLAAVGIVIDRGLLR